MDTKKKRRDGTSGLLSLEACIALFTFIFLMLFLYSFLVVFEARNTIAHVLLTTTDSLALDSFANETADDKSIQGLLYGLYSNYVDSDGLYTESSKWYSGDAMQICDTIETRFVAYLAGGDQDLANEILKGLNIENGLKGLDFTNSSVDSGNLTVKVRYTIDYEFNLFGLDKLEMEQSACSKMWGFSGSMSVPAETEGS